MRSDAAVFLDMLLSLKGCDDKEGPAKDHKHVQSLGYIYSASTLTRLSCSPPKLNWGLPDPRAIRITIPRWCPVPGVRTA